VVKSPPAKQVVKSPPAKQVTKRTPPANAQGFLGVEDFLNPKNAIFENLIESTRPTSRGTRKYTFGDKSGTITFGVSPIKKGNTAMNALRKTDPTKFREAAKKLRTKTFSGSDKAVVTGGLNTLTVAQKTKFIKALRELNDQLGTENTSILFL
jgi:hypothetical protein